VANASAVNGSDASAVAVSTRAWASALVSPSPVVSIVAADPAPTGVWAPRAPTAAIRRSCSAVTIRSMVASRRTVPANRSSEISSAKGAARSRATHPSITSSSASVSISAMIVSARERASTATFAAGLSGTRRVRKLAATSEQVMPVH
jgi:hypothetical protein